MTNANAYISRLVEEDQACHGMLWDQPKIEWTRRAPNEDAAKFAGGPQRTLGNQNGGLLVPP